MSKNFVLPARFFVGEKFRGGQLTHENFTPRKLHAIRYILPAITYAIEYNIHVYTAGYVVTNQTWITTEVR